MNAQSPHDKILSAARHIVAERGLAALSVHTVATEAGVTKSAISYHFGNKDGLIRAILESMVVPQGDEARAAIRRVDHPADRFHAFMALYLDRVKNNENFRIAFALGPSPFSDAKIRVSGRTSTADRDALRLPPDDPHVDVLMSVLMAAITGLAFHYSSMRAITDLNACFAQLEESMAPAFVQAMIDRDRSEG
jgi:AcrR family transcriptional regulator